MWVGVASMTKQEDKHDIEVYRKFLINCARGKERFSKYLGDGKWKSLSAKKNKESMEIALIGFINDVLGEKK